MDNKLIRLRNIQYLVSEAGSSSALAKKLGREQSQVSQWLGGKGIGDRLARDVEVALGRPRGWLDHSHEDSELGDGSGASQSARLSVAKVIGTTKALRTFLRRRGLEYDPIEYADLFVAAYGEAEKLSDDPTDDETLAFASVVVDLIQEREGRKDGRQDDQQAGGETGGKDRQSRTG